MNKRICGAILAVLLWCEPALAGINLALSSSPIYQTEMPGGAKVVSNSVDVGKMNFLTTRQLVWEETINRMVLTSDVDQWQYTMSSVDMYEEHLKYPLRGFIRDLAKRSKTCTILDWGLGGGMGADELSKFARLAGFEEVKVVGIGDIAYPTWRGLSSDIEVIFDSGWNLFDYTHRRQFDVAISHRGLGHMIYRDEKTAPLYMEQLFKGLKEEGVFITDFQVHDFLNDYELQRLGVYQQPVGIAAYKKLYDRNGYGSSPVGASVRCSSRVIREEQ